MKLKNTICLWFGKDAHEAARFYAVTFPDSKVTAVHDAPGDYPGGKKGDVLTVEFTVLGNPVSVSTADRRSSTPRRFPSRSRRRIRKRRTVTGTRDHRQWRHGKRVRLVQGPLGPLLADHPARADRCACGRWR
jgi:3-demethylubiquinone-9 3-methyltransferase